MIVNSSSVGGTKQRGMALIVVLTMLTVVIGLAANYVLSVSRESQSVDILNVRTQARYSAFSGVQYALFAMQDRDKTIRWKPGGKVYRVELAGGEVFAKIMPESGRMDINAAHPMMLRLLFQYAGLPEVEAEKVMKNVLHWRSRDDVVQGGDSVVDADYEAAGKAKPKHRRFYAIEELAQVYGVTPQMYSRIKPLITVYGSGRVNGLVASDEMLRLLQLDDAKIAAINEARLAYYENEAAIPKTVSGMSPFLRFNVRSAYYRVLSYATTVNGQTEAVYSVIKNRRDRTGTYREMQRGVVSGKERERLIDEVNTARQQLVEEG